MLSTVAFQTNQQDELDPIIALLIGMGIFSLLDD